MKKLALFAGLFLLANEKIPAQTFTTNTSFRLNTFSPALDFSFYFHPGFIHSTLNRPQSSLLFSDKNKTVYSRFEAIRYHFPEQAIFCRMENNICKRYGFMFSVHTGGYSER